MTEKDPNWARYADKMGRANMFHYFINPSESACGLYQKNRQYTIHIQHAPKNQHIKKCKNCKRYSEGQIERGGKILDLAEKSAMDSFTKKVEQIYEIPTINIASKTFWIKSECSYPGCYFEGIFPTCNINEAKNHAHYCPEHNTRIQETIRQTEILQQFEQEIILS